jgi:hypothetical protein
VSDQEGGGPIVWLPGGLLLAVLMSVPQTRWLSCVAGMLLGVAVASLVSDGSIVISGGPALSVIRLSLATLAMQGISARSRHAAHCASATRADRIQLKEERV